MSDTIQALGDAAEKAIRDLIREIVARRAGGHLVEDHLGEIRLPADRLSRRGELSAELVSEVERMVDDAIRRAAAFRPGRALCHRCEDSSCAHAVPPSCRHVFVAYSPTGTPVWEDFAQYALDAKHPDVDRLYDDRPAFLTEVLAGDQLRRVLLPAFGAGAYEVKGQLLAGFFAVRTREAEGRGVLALTFQVVASRGARRPGRLALNILGRAPGGEELETLWDRYREVPWRRGVRWAQSALSSIRPRRGGRDGPGHDRRIEGILQGLARRLQQDVRARGRRTEHAERRHESGRRPTRKAIDDIREASDGAILADERSGTIVVLGDRGRTHFFAPDGRLVSSVRYSRDAIERKRKHGVWRDASVEEARRLRERILDPGESGAG